MKKRLTSREKRSNAMIKKELQAEGVLPPDKPKLNRKKFIEEAMNEWNSRDKDVFVWELYLAEAFSLMLGYVEKNSLRASLEAVGAAKVLKIALRLREFSKKLQGEGRDKYTAGEKYEFVKDIIDA